MGGELRCRRLALLGKLSCKIRNKAGSELECPTRICPERNDDGCDQLPIDLWEELTDKPPKDLWDEVFLCVVGLKSCLHIGQNVALINQRSTHLAWNTCWHSRTRHMSGAVALNCS